MKNYIWRKNDTMGGLSNAIHTVTSHNTKERMMSYFKDCFERDMMKVYSEDLIEEMKTIVRDGAGWPEPPVTLKMRAPDTPIWAFEKTPSDHRR